MKKNQFIILIMCVVAGLIFSLGMCMCLLPEWNMFTLGVILTAVGGAVLLVLGLVFWVKHLKNKAPTNWKLVGKIVFAIIATLVLGLGMCMILVWNIMLWGIIVGILGIVMLLFLIPMFGGLRK